MLFPRIESESSEVGSRLRAVILTVLRWVFICMSTPTCSRLAQCGYKTEKGSKRTCDRAVDYGAVLELDGDRLIVQFHKKPVWRELAL